MPHETEELLYNWSNTLRTHEKGARLVAAQTAADYRKQGFNSGEAYELLLADSFEDGVAREAIAEAYPETVARTASAKREAMTVPTSYDEVAPIIEDALGRLGAKEFVNRLTQSEQPIVRSSRKHLDSWYRLAQKAEAEGSYAMSLLHQELRPWVEEAMLTSVLMAEKQGGRVAQLESSKYRVVTSQESVEVCLASGQSSGARYTGGHFADFGLADEHLVRVADHVSPHQRLRRALRSE